MIKKYEFATMVKENRKKGQQLLEEMVARETTQRNI